jgi:hypothetical protein
MNVMTYDLKPRIFCKIVREIETGLKQDVAAYHNIFILIYKTIRRHMILILMAVKISNFTGVS